MSSRTMIYPYTFTAKLVHFPYKYYYKNVWTVRYLPWAILASYPLFKLIHNLANSPANVAKYEAEKRKDHEEHLHHLEHLR